MISQQLNTDPARPNNVLQSGDNEWLRIFRPRRELCGARSRNSDVKYSPPEEYDEDEATSRMESEGPVPVMPHGRKDGGGKHNTAGR